MKWIKTKTKLPPKRPNPYQVLVTCIKVYEDGNYKEHGKKTVVQDWVVRQWEENFTHWIEIEEPN
jgi:hypothetical protein